MAKKMLQKKEPGTTIGNPLFHLDPVETKTDWAMARWFVGRPVGDSRKNVRGYLVNEELQGILVRDESEAVTMAVSLNWDMPISFSLEKDENNEDILRAPYNPTTEEIDALPQAPISGNLRKTDNLHLWPYDKLMRTAQNLSTAGPEIPGRAMRQQLAQFVRAKRKQNLEAEEQAKLDQIVQRVLASGAI